MAEENDALFKEIDEELRQDEFNKLWKAYGNYLIGGVLAIILSVAGFQGWQSYSMNQRMERGELFDLARVLVTEDKVDEAIRAFADVSDGKSDGYALLARFRTAGLLAQSGDYAGAADTYKSLAADSDLDQSYRDLAIVLGALQELNTSEDIGLVSRLSALDTGTNPWRHNAREALGVSALKSGDKARARDIFKALSEDATAPRGLARRAGEMLKTIGQ